MGRLERRKREGNTPKSSYIAPRCGVPGGQITFRVTFFFFRAVEKEGKQSKAKEKLRRKKNEG